MSFARGIRNLVTTFLPPLSRQAGTLENPPGLMSAKSLLCMRAATKPALCPSCRGLFGPVCRFCDLLLRSSAVCRGFFFLTLLGLDAFQNPASAKSSAAAAQAACRLRLPRMYSLLAISVHKAGKWHSIVVDEVVFFSLSINS